jgi:hypothetical protein
VSQAGPPRGRGPFQSGAVDWDLLADHLGGALPGTPEQERVAHLIMTDPRWARAAAELSRALDAVATDLARVPAPAMPCDIAGRLDAALRAAAGGHAAAGWVDAPAGGPLRQRQPADAGGRPAGEPRRPAGRPAGRRLATRWAAGLATAAAVVAVAIVGIGNLALPGGDDDAGGFAQEEASRGEDGRQPDLLVSGTDYRRSSLPAAAPRAGTMAAEPGAEGAPAPNVAGEPDSADSAESAADDRLPDPAAQLDPALRDIRSQPGPCLAEINDLYAPSPVTVEAVDFATFEGTPALVAWIDTGGGHREVVVAGPDCGQPGAGADVRHRTPVG